MLTPESWLLDNWVHGADHRPSRWWSAISHLECGDMSPLSLDATCRVVPKRSHACALHSALILFPARCARPQAAAGLCHPPSLILLRRGFGAT
jgi:hypothetical protein